MLQIWMLHLEKQLIWLRLKIICMLCFLCIFLQSWKYLSLIIFIKEGVLELPQLSHQDFSRRIQDWLFALWFSVFQCSGVFLFVFIM
ncbi:hypothetical protein Leryth_025933 [Lithospermum erythrorhizon]|nr:hypothetical protein Leryth_025933 [Lithospermum erythrorhizon]